MRMNVICRMLILPLALLLLSIPASAEDAPDAAGPVERLPLDFSISPTRIRLHGGPGATAEGVITVYNTGSRSLSVEAQTSDMMNLAKENGELERIYPPSGSTEYSCAPWILLEDTEFVLAPGTQRRLNFIMTAPPDAAGGYSAVIFLQGTPERSNEGEDPSKAQRSVVVRPRLGVLAFYEVQDTVIRTGAIRGEITYDLPTDDDPMFIRYEFMNTGNADILLTGTFHIMNANGALIAKDNLNILRTFPGDIGVVVTEWDGALDPGEYHMVISLELGPDAQEVILKEYDFIVS